MRGGVSSRREMEQRIWEMDLDVDLVLLVRIHCCYPVILLEVDERWASKLLEIGRGFVCSDSNSRVEAGILS